MRFAQLKLNGKLITASLVCGGPGFKVYCSAGSWLIKCGRSVFEADQALTSQYVLLKYQPAHLQQEIAERFMGYVLGLRSTTVAVDLGRA